MYSSNSQNHYSTLLEEIQGAGLYKNERVITSPQSALITVGGNKVLNFCANNYLGLADNQDLIEAAKKGLTHTDLDFRPFASFAEPKIFIRNLRPR